MVNNFLTQVGVVVLETHGNSFSLDLEDDLCDEDNEENDMGEDEKEDEFGDTDGIESTIHNCCYCGVEVYLEEFPDSISREAFESFGICLNCQWGIFVENGGQF